VIVVGKEMSLRSQLPHILNTESGCLTDRCIIQAIEQLPRDRQLFLLNTFNYSFLLVINKHFSPFEIFQFGLRRTAIALCSSADKVVKWAIEFKVRQS